MDFYVFSIESTLKTFGLRSEDEYDIIAQKLSFLKNNYFNKNTLNVTPFYNPLPPFSSDRIYWNM